MRETVAVPMVARLVGECLSEILSYARRSTDQYVKSSLVRSAYLLITGEFLVDQILCYRGPRRLGR